MNHKKVTTSIFRKMKQAQEKITMLTAYDYPTAKVLDRSGVDSILVGDSLGMVVLGYEDTTQVTMEDMIHHIKAVTRGAKRAMVIGDMPFLSYHCGVAQAVLNAGRIIQEGQAQAVKLEGGCEIIEEIKGITRAGIPVVGHIGLTPQSIHKFGGYFIQGKTAEQARKLIDDALALEAAGIFALVLECVPAELAEIISSKLSIPTIGIGAGKGCDGQVLVIHDLVGFYQEKSPSFAKRYGELGAYMEQWASKYNQEVKSGAFPAEEHSFHMNSDEIGKIYGGKA